MFAVSARDRGPDLRSGVFWKSVAQTAGGWDFARGPVRPKRELGWLRTAQE